MHQSLVPPCDLQIIFLSFFYIKWFDLAFSKRLTTILSVKDIWCSDVLWHVYISICILLLMCLYASLAQRYCLYSPFIWGVVSLWCESFRCIHLAWYPNENWVYISSVSPQDVMVLEPSLCPRLPLHLWSLNDNGCHIGGVTVRCKALLILIVMTH